jgi:hypothetical protein
LAWNRCVKLNALGIGSPEICRKKIGFTSASRTEDHGLKSGLPYFSWYYIPKEEIYIQITTKYAKWPQNKPTVSIPGPSQNVPNFGFLVCKYRYNLATLVLIPARVELLYMLLIVLCMYSTLF